MQTQQLQKQFFRLCPPAMVYLALAGLALIINIMLNYKHINKICVGKLFSCTVPSTLLVFILQAASTLFWTYVLDLICKDGHEILSWLLVVMPAVVTFFVGGILMMNIT